MAEPISHSMTQEQAKAAWPTASLMPDQWKTAEKCLNYFVGAVALMERVGNCLGTLAFTWATVVVLGGFSTNLGVDFWYATAIVFLEAFRVFSRESRSDDELLFRTTGSIKLKRMKLSRGIPYYLTVSIVIVCMYGTLEFSLRHHGYSPPLELRLQYHILLLSVLLAFASVVQAPVPAGYLNDNAWLQFISALVAVLALGSAMLWSHAPKREVLLIIPPLFVGCFQSVFKPIQSCLENSGRNTGWFGFLSSRLLGTLLALILPAWIVISVLIEFSSMGILLLLGTLMLSNIQVPVAVARIVISVVRLYIKDKSRDAGNEHLAPALTIFYSMVLAQGLLYLAACVLESLLSSYFRRSLALSCNLLTSKKRYESINLYYEHAYNKRMEEGVLAQEDMGLVTFAFHSLDSNSDDKKLAAVHILDSLLRLERDSNAELVSNKIITSNKVVASLINMLGWTSASEKEQGTYIRLFTAEVIASLARHLRIVGIPGTVQMVSSLLDVDAKDKKQKQDMSNKNEVNINDNQQRSQAPSTLVTIQGEQGDHAPRDSQKLSKQMEESNGRKRRYVKIKISDCVTNMLHELDEWEPLKDTDSLFPALGMRILEGLAHDLDNCLEICKAPGLIKKIIGFIINTTNTTNNIIIPSLELIAKLASTEGEMGTTIREKILFQDFFLMSNLVEILVYNHHHSKQWKLAMVIIAKMILEDGKIKDVEKFIDVIIPGLMIAFLGPHESSNTDYDHSLRLLAGEVLSKMAKKNDPSIFMAILQERGYSLIQDLKDMLRKDEYINVAASLLINLCAHSQDKLHHLRPNEELSSVLQVVLQKIPDAEGKQLEVLIITALQIRDLIPLQYFACELESHIDKEILAEKLVDALNSNNKMCCESPTMRRVVVEITISIIESCSLYSPIFKSKRMMEALSNVEKILAKMEKYKAFLDQLGDINVLNSGLPPPDLVTKAKQLIGSPNEGANVHDSSSLDIVHIN